MLMVLEVRREGGRRKEEGEKERPHNGEENFLLTICKLA